MERLSRAAAYAVVGFAAESAFNGALAPFRGERVLRLRTSLWMLPVYALVQPLFEPAHERLRDRPWPVRAAAYGAGFIGVEYVSGRALRRLRGSAPWDYSHVRFQVHGLIRSDYFPLWALAGLGLERLHDRLSCSGRLPAAPHWSAATRSTAPAPARSRS